MTDALKCIGSYHRLYKWLIIVILSICSDQQMVQIKAAIYYVHMHKYKLML